MNKRLLICLLISLIIHILLLAQITFENKSGVKKDQPIMVDIMKKKKESEKPPVNPNVLSDRDLELKKKIENEEQKKEINKPAISERGTVKSIRKQKSEKTQPAQKKRAENKKIVTQNKSPVAIQNKNKNNTNDKKSEKDLPHVKNEKHNVDQSIDKDKLARILNPSDILNEIAKKEEGNVKEGEDEVNIEAMKFKYYSYFYKFKRLLYQVWEYPPSSIYNGEEGTVRIKFSILKDGKITNIQVVESSGYPDLDRAAVRALQTMKGVPLPSSYKLNILHVDGYFSYNIYRMRIY
jgi:protein TonB